jgi:hypothetical protein
MRESGEELGDYAIQQGTLALTSNYNLTFHGALLTIEKGTPTLSVTNSPVIYNGLPQEAQVSASVPGTITQVTYDGIEIIPVTAGSYTVAANFIPDDTIHYNSLSSAPAGEFIILPADPVLILAIIPTPDTFTQAGDIIELSYLLTNNGNIPLTGPFSVTDNLVAVTCTEADSLNTGDSLSCDATYTITSSDELLGLVQYTATASGYFLDELIISNIAYATVTSTKIEFQLYLPLVME